MVLAKKSVTLGQGDEQPEWGLGLLAIKIACGWADSMNCLSEEEKEP